LGEGWSPERGWLDSSFFLYPSSSEIKIYQIHMRTVRNGDNKKNSYAVIQSLITDKFDKTNTKYNNAFKMTKTVLDALEIGQDDISELVSFRKFINLPAGKKSLGSGNTTQNTHLSELDSNLVSKAFVNYVKEGHYYPYAQSVNEIVEWWCDTVTDNIDTMCWGRSSKSYIEKVGVKATIKKFKDYFDNFTAAESLREKIITGSHWLVSEKNIERIADVEELMITVKQKMIQNIRRDASAGYQRQLVNHSQHNFWFRDVLKKYNMQDTPHLIFKNTYDIVETFEKQKHFDKQKMKIVKLIMQNITKVKSANELVSLIISKLDNVGIEPQKVLNESFFKRNFIEQDRYKVFSTTQRTKFKQLRKAINQQGKHGNNIAWNKGKNYTFAELRKKRNIA
jgi:regulator of RNase E activity RraB